MKSAILVFGLASLCGAAIVGTSGRHFLNRAAPDQLEGGQPAGALPLGEKPGHWVPFSARITRVFDPGNVFVGKFYRASDGSTRSETGPQTGDVNSIGIKNMAEKMFYLWNPSRGWESHPMELPGGKYFQPPPDGFLSGKPVVEQIEGLDVIATPGGNGTVQYLAATLNYFPVKILWPCNSQGTGCGFWLSDISINEQPPELFKPPAGDLILERSEPGGIVRGRPRG